MDDDRELLRQFIETHDGQAFAALVRRHINLVYSAAVRQMRDPGAAEDVTQGVFVLLANKAHEIRNPQALCGWLLVATRGIALNAQRAESRRRHRESEAAAMKNQETSPSESDWEAIKPVLDEAVGRLKPIERDALTLRFFENRDVSQVAEALGISQVAAQKRLSRAVIHLREMFASKGITTSTEALSGLLLTHAVGAAPEALLVKVAASASTAAQSIASIQTAKGMGVIMAMSAQAKMAVGIAAAIVITAGVSIPVVNHFTGASLPAPVTPPTSSPANTFASTESNWEIVFKAVYGLDPGENVRRIVPPFIPERVDFYTSPQGGRGRLGPRESVPTSYVITWDGTDLRWKSMITREERGLASAFREVGGIWPQETNIPIDSWATLVPGDWVVRVDAPTEQKLAVISEAVFGPGNVLKLFPMERDVIVVKGEFEYRPLANAQGRLTGPTPDVYLYHGSDTAMPNFRIMAQTQQEMLMKVGEILGKPVIVEAKLRDPQPIILALRQRPEDRLKAGQFPDDAMINEVLGIITVQTSLKFEHQRRMVPTWQLVQVRNANR